MTYFKVGNRDLSKYVAKLKITKKNNYTSQTNANGDSVVDYINTKRVIEVEIIPLKEKDFRTVLWTLDFNCTVYYRDPQIGTLFEVNCIIKDNDIEYYTIQQNKVMYKKMKLTFYEL